LGALSAGAMGALEICGEQASLVAGLIATLLDPTLMQEAQHVHVARDKPGHPS